MHSFCIFKYLQNRPPVQMTGGLFGRGPPTLAPAPQPGGTATLNIDYMCLGLPGHRIIHIISSDLFGEPSSTTCSCGPATVAASSSMHRAKEYPCDPTKSGTLTIVDVVREPRHEVDRWRMSTIRPKTVTLVHLFPFLSLSASMSCFQRCERVNSDAERIL